MALDKTSPSGTDALLAAMERIEGKLDVLIAALAGEEEEELPATTLDGQPAGGERDQKATL